MNDQQIIQAIDAAVLRLAVLNKNVLTESEAAWYIGKKVSTLRKMVCLRIIPVCKPGGAKGSSDSYFLKEDLEAYMSSNRRNGKAELDSMAATILFKKSA